MRTKENSAPLIDYLALLEKEYKPSEITHELGITFRERDYLHHSLTCQAKSYLESSRSDRVRGLLDLDVTSQRALKFLIHATPEFLKLNDVQLTPLEEEYLMQVRLRRSQQDIIKLLQSKGFTINSSARLAKLSKIIKEKIPLPS